MSVSVDRDSPTYQVIAGDSDDMVIETLRDLARWLYRQLQHEYEDQTSDDAVDEIIIANGYPLPRQADASARPYG